jgi:hypothetical protein
MLRRQRDGVVSSGVLSAQALPGADNALMALEHASDDELRAAGDSHREIRRAALDEQSGPAPPGG